MVEATDYLIDLVDGPETSNRATPTAQEVAQRDELIARIIEDRKRKSAARGAAHQDEYSETLEA